MYKDLWDEKFKMEDILDFNNKGDTEYKETGNPLYVWYRIRHCWRMGRPLPPWVMEYLVEVAENLLNIKSDGKRYRDQIPKALGLSGHSFVQYKNKPVGTADQELSECQDIYERVEYINNKRKKYNEDIKKSVQKKATMEEVYEVVAIHKYGNMDFVEKVKKKYNKWKNIQKILDEDELI